MSTKLSFIVPAYNVDQYICETIESLVNIRFSQPYEIIVINDGSTDRTEEIVKGYQNRYDTIRLLNVQNGGVSRARNIGLETATGEYIAFVDGDDLVSPDIFQLAVQKMDMGYYTFVQANYKILNDEGETEKKLVDSETVLSDRDACLRAFICKGKSIYNAVWGKVFRSEALRDIRFDETINISEDRKFVFDIIQKSEKVLLIPDIGYSYRKRETSAMNATSIVMRYDDNMKVLLYMEEHVILADVLNAIEGKKIDSLLALYSGCGDDSKRRTDYYVAFKQTSLKKAWWDIDWKVKIKAAILKTSRCIFDHLVLKDR